jgi:hypothetical protein
MPLIVLVARLMRDPAMAILGTLGCAIAAKSGTAAVSLAYLCAIATLMLMCGLVTSIARMRRFHRHGANP